MWSVFLLALIPATTAQLIVSCIPEIAPAQCTAIVTNHGVAARDINFCKLENDILKHLHELAEDATSFCSSYLHIPSATTVTAGTVTPQPV